MATVIVHLQLGPLARVCSTRFHSENKRGAETHTACTMSNDANATTSSSSAATMAHYNRIKKFDSQMSWLGGLI